MHLLDTSGTTGIQYRLIDCNCGVLGQARKGSCAIYPQNQPFYGTLPGSTTPSHVPQSVQSTSPFQLGPGCTSPAWRVPGSDHYSVPFATFPSQTPKPVQSSGWGYADHQSHPDRQLSASTPQLCVGEPYGLPVNATYGVYKLERRAAIITNLNYNTKEAQLRNLILPIAPALRIDMTTDSQGKNRGSAVVYFSSASEVQNVVKRLSNFKFDGKHLKVRLDRNGTSTQDLHLPVVVHSSNHQASGI